MDETMRSMRKNGECLNWMADDSLDESTGMPRIDSLGAVELEDAADVAAGTAGLRGAA